MVVLDKNVHTIKGARSTYHCDVEGHERYEHERHCCSIRRSVRRQRPNNVFE